MAIRLSDLRDYSTGVAVSPAVQPLPGVVVPSSYAAQALMRRGENGLSLSEMPGERRVRLNGLGELVQVVT